MLLMGHRLWKEWDPRMSLGEHHAQDEDNMEEEVEPKVTENDLLER